MGSTLDGALFSPSKRRPQKRWDEIVLQPTRQVVLYEHMKALLPSGYVPPPWLQARIVKERAYEDQLSDFNYVTTLVLSFSNVNYDTNVFYGDDPYVYFWYWIYVFTSNANYDPSNPQSNSFAYPNIIFPDPFPKDEDVTADTLASWMPTARPNLLNSSQQGFFQWALNILVNSNPGRSLQPSTQTVSWDVLLKNPNTFSITFLAMMHCVARAIDAGLVKNSVRPFPTFLEILCVPQRRDVNWEATLNDKILDPDNPASAKIEQPNDYKSERGWGPRSKYWETIVTSAARMCRRWLLDTETRTVLDKELQLVKNFGLKSQPVEDPLEFMLDVCARMLNAPPEEYNVSENVKTTIQSIEDELQKPRGPKQDGNTGVGILYRVWHPRWQAMYPEDSVILGDKESEWSLVEPAIQARPPLFPWYISTEHGGPLKADGDVSNAQEDPKNEIEPFDFLPLKYRAYDSYFTHPDEQMVFYQKIIVAVENHPTHRQYLPPPTWFDGYFLERLSRGKWDVRQQSNGAWDFQDFGDKSGVAKGSPQANLYISQNEKNHEKSSEYYLKQLQTVIDESNFDGFDDARTEFWYRVYYMQKNERPNGLMLEFAHPKKLGKTRKFFRDLLNGIEKVENAVAGVVVSVAETTSRVFIKSAGELTSSIIRDVGGQVAPIARSLLDVGADILSSLGIKWPANMGKGLKNAIVIFIFAVVAYILVRFILLRRRSSGGIINANANTNTN
jgi:hypothetical protein